MKTNRSLRFPIAALILLGVQSLSAQTPTTPTTPAAPAPAAAAAPTSTTRRPVAADTEVWEPQPTKVTPGPFVATQPPADAIILFDGTTTNEWVNTTNKMPVAWTVADGVLTVNKSVRSNIETKRTFKNYQLHIEWRIPSNITGNDQSRGNSGVFLASTGAGDAGYELQILDSYENKTYANGMAASIYKQFIPLANPSRPAGEWNVYDVAWTAPTFNDDGTVRTPARLTAFFNGVLAHNNVELKGETLFVGPPTYKKYDSAPIKLQTHGDPSPPVSFRNIWVRES